MAWHGSALHGAAWQRVAWHRVAWHHLEQFPSVRSPLTWLGSPGPDLNPNGLLSVCSCRWQEGHDSLSLTCVSYCAMWLARERVAAGEQRKALPTGVIFLITHADTLTSCGEPDWMESAVHRRSCSQSGSAGPKARCGWAPRSATTTIVPTVRAGRLQWVTTGSSRRGRVVSVEKRKERNRNCRDVQVVEASSRRKWMRGICRRFSGRYSTDTALHASTSPSTDCICVRLCVCAPCRPCKIENGSLRRGFQVSKGPSFLVIR